MYLLGKFDVYDREESLGQELNRYDPNVPEDLKALLDKYFFPYWSENHGYTPQHRWEFAKSVAEALATPDFDFAALFLSNDHECFYLPSSWEIVDARLFYTRAYRLLFDRWSHEWRGILPGLPDPAGAGQAG